MRKFKINSLRKSVVLFLVSTIAASAMVFVIVFANPVYSQVSQFNVPSSGLMKASYENRSNLFKDLGMYMFNGQSEHWCTSNIQHVPGSLGAQVGILNIGTGVMTGSSELIFTTTAANSVIAQSIIRYMPLGNYRAGGYSATQNVYTVLLHGANYYVGHFTYDTPVVSFP